MRPGPKKRFAPIAVGAESTTSCSVAVQHSAIAENAHDQVPDFAAFLAATTFVTICYRALINPEDYDQRRALQWAFDLCEARGQEPRWVPPDANCLHVWRISYRDAAPRLPHTGSRPVYGPSCPRS